MLDTYRPGSKLVFYANTLEVIARNEILQKATQMFEIIITGQQIDEAKKVVLGDTSVHQIKTWLLRLIKRLYDGIVNGTYKVLPLHLPTVDEDIPENIELQSFLDLAKHHNDVDDVIAVDDRLLTANLYQGKARIVTSHDLLTAMLENQNLQPEKYFQLLTRYRRSNIRYIPYIVNEIAYHAVTNYDETSFTLIETLPLKTMKDYIHACLNQTEVLQLNPAEGAPILNGEIVFIRTTFEQICGSIAFIWANSKPPIASISSQWIIEKLYLPNRDIFIEHNILKIDTLQNDFSYPELYAIGDSLQKFPARRNEYSISRRYKIWFWQWVHPQFEGEY